MRALGNTYCQEIMKKRSAIRYADVLIRWGGEEFLVVSRFTDRENAEILAKRVLQAIGTESFHLISGSIRRTCSIGWAVFPWSPEHPDAISYQDVIRLADRALYKAKDTRRNMAVGVLPELASCHSEKRGRHSGHSGIDERMVRTLITQGP